LRRSIIDLFVEKNEKGEWKQENGNFNIIEEKKAEFEKEMAKFMELPIEIDYFKLRLTELNEVKIAAFEIMALEPFIDEELEGTRTLQIIE